MVDHRIKLFGIKGISPHVIKKLQLYYSKAIRDNTGDLKGMVNAVQSVYLHHLNPDKKSNHRLCSDQWCFQKNKNIKRKLLCPPQCIQAIESVFKDLGNQKLLEKCTHGLTQNVNEGFNGLIWRRFPKSTFSRFASLKIALFDAIITYNDGYVQRGQVFKNLGFDIGSNTEAGLLALDESRKKNKEKRRTNYTRSVDTAIFQKLYS